MYGRHSKSLDVAKQRCGRCLGALRYAGAFEQDGTPVRARPPSAFARFVADHFARAKRQAGAGASHAAVMAALGEEWRARKAVVPATLANGASDGGSEGSPAAVRTARGARESGGESGVIELLSSDSDGESGSGVGNEAEQGDGRQAHPTRTQGARGGGEAARVLDAMFAALQF